MAQAEKVDRQADQKAQVATKNSKPRKAAPSKPRLSKEEQSARNAVNNQLEAQLSSLLSTPKAKDVVAPSANKQKGPEKKLEPASGKKQEGVVGPSLRGNQAGSKKAGGREGVRADEWHDACQGRELDANGLIPIGEGPEDPLAEVRSEFRTASPAFRHDEDASRHIGHSFRDRGGEFGAMPKYDNHDD